MCTHSSQIALFQQYNLSYLLDIDSFNLKLIDICLLELLSVFCGIGNFGLKMN